MAAEDTAERMQLVDDDVAEVLEELRPSRMVRKNPRMQHVRIAEHHIGAGADRAAGVLGRIAVVGEDSNLLARSRRDGLAKRLQLGELILRQRLGRKEIQRAARRILKNGMQNRRVVAQRLSG